MDTDIEQGLLTRISSWPEARSPQPLKQEAVSTGKQSTQILNRSQARPCLLFLPLFLRLPLPLLLLLPLASLFKVPGSLFQV